MRLLILNENVSQLNYIKKHLKNVESENIDIVADELYNADPTNNKKYIKWLIKQFIHDKIGISKINDWEILDPQIRLPEDRTRINELLDNYDKYKARIPIQMRDIMKLDINNLQDIIEEYVADNKNSYIQIGDEPLPGSELVYNNDPYKIFVVRKFEKIVDKNRNAKRNALKKLGLGTKWCTREDYKTPDNKCMATHYLLYSDVYVIYKNNKPFIQFDLDSMQMADVKDHMLKAYQIPEDLKKILLHIIPDSTDKAKYFKIIKLQDEQYTKENSNAIKTNPDLALKYAMEVIGGRWFDAEPYILQDVYSSYLYAKNVIKDRWYEFEEILLNRELTRDIEHIIIKYVRYLMGRWPEIEPKILTSPSASMYYAYEILEERWPEAEPIIATSANYAYTYLVRFIDGRWPEAEPAFAKSPEIALKYIENYVKDRWPEAEPTLKNANDESIWRKYLHLLNKFKIQKDLMQNVFK